MSYARTCSSETHSPKSHSGIPHRRTAFFVLVCACALVAFMFCLTLTPRAAFAEDIFADDTTLVTTSDKTSYQAGDTATIQFTIKNNTEAALDVATIDVTLPSQMSLVSGSLSHDAAGLAAGESKTFTLTAQIAGGGLAKTSDNGGLIALVVVAAGIVCAAVALLLARKKKLIGPFAAIAFVFCATLALPSAAYGDEIGDFYENSHAVTINGQSAAINFKVNTTYDGELHPGLNIVEGVVKSSPNATGAVKIPKIYEGFPVTKIDDFAFEECDIAVCEDNDPETECSCKLPCVGVCNCERKTAIRIPDTITEIGKFAFQSCSDLTSVVIPDSVITIGEGAFKKCRGLTTTNIPGSVESLGPSVFELCSILTNVEIAESCSTISNRLFKDCNKLASITLPSSIQTIGIEAFLKTNLTTIHIPDAVQEIGISAFDGCTSLKSVTFGANPQITTLPDSLFAGCAALKEFSIPSSVTAIGNGVFSGTSLTSIVIPDSVASIGNSVFKKCLSLGTVTFSGNPQIELIDAETFYGCTVLEDFIIPLTVTKIEFGAFQNCTSLTAIDIPDSVGVIGTDAFNGCSSLAQVNFGVESKLLRIEQYAFAECTSLQSFTVPSTVIRVLPNAFKNCAQLSEVVFQGVIPGEHYPYTDQIFEGTDDNLPYLYYTTGADKEWEDFYKSDMQVFGKDIKPYPETPVP